jgi:hypothetical protein
MKAPRIATVVLLCSFVLSIGAPASLFAAGEAKKGGKGGVVECQMTFNLRSWSAFYKSANGDGTITCSNGQKARVKIAAKGGGITFGKSEIVGGTGKFTGARNISELFGSYAQSEAHAGAVKSADAQGLTKGEISLALAGTGRGFDIGFDFGKFTIQRAK